MFIDPPGRLTNALNVAMVGDSRSDKELIYAHHEGDAAAFTYLTERYLTSIYRFLTRLLKDPRSAEDLAQETFLKAWKYLHTFKTETSFKTWLFTIARNTAIDYLRKQRPHTFSELEDEDSLPFTERIIDPQPLPNKRLEHKQLTEELEEALATLPLTSRTIVLLHETEELTFQEIADILKEPMNTVKSRYRRALQTLHQFLKNRL